MSESTDGNSITGKYRALLLGGVVIGIAILAGLIVFWPRSECEGIFEQTAPRLEANMEIIRNKGALAVGQEKIQELAESAQKVGLHLKTCCSVLAGGKLNPAQFQQCVDSAAGYERQVAKVAQQVNAVEKTPAAGSTSVSPQARAAISNAISEATRGAANLAQQVTQLKPAAAAVAATPATAAVSGHETEPNDTPTGANPVALGTQIDGAIQKDGDADYYKVTASKQVRDLVKVSLENLSETLVPQLTLFNQDKSKLGNDHYDYTPGANLEFYFTAEVGVSNYVRVSGVSNSSGAYRLRLSYQDAADTYEPNDNAAQSADIALDKPVPGSILDGEDQDWYRFKAASASTHVRMDNDSSTLAPQFSIYDENRAKLGNPYNGTNGASIDYNLSATPGKLYYIQVVPYGDTFVPGKYRISVTGGQ